MNTTKTIADYAFHTRATGHFVPSPCISVCTINPASQLCDGCLRTLDEIADWPQMGNADKRAVWACIDQRAAAAKAKNKLDNGA
jgi:uncharacterized protein